MPAVATALLAHAGTLLVTRRLRPRRPAPGGAGRGRGSRKKAHIDVVARGPSGSLNRPALLPARPGVPEAVDEPVLQHLAPASGVPAQHLVAPPVGGGPDLRPAAADRVRAPCRGAVSEPLVGDAVAVHGAHDAVRAALHHDRRRDRGFAGPGGGSAVRPAIAPSACPAPFAERYAGAEATPAAAKTSG